MCSIYAILGLFTVIHAYGKKNVILKHDCRLNTKLCYLCRIFVANKISFVKGHSASANLNQSARAHHIYLQSFTDLCRVRIPLLYYIHACIKNITL